MRKFLFIVLCLSTRLYGQTPVYEEDKVVIKFSEVINEGVADDNILTLEELSRGLKIDQCIKLYENNQSAQQSQYLRNIFEVKLIGKYNIDRIAKRLSTYDNVIYATPLFIEKPFEIPNDTFAAPGNAQDHLDVIRAYDAWDINKGDTSVVIGIIDGLINYNHEDLFDNLQVNLADPINGIDDDLNGYTDDFYGYDFADRDNDPSGSAPSHGMRVAGVSSAVTNNDKGIAGTGYNSRFFPMKVIAGEGNGNIQNGYEAILYAADLGLDVVNLSWGGTGFFSRFRQDQINYAVLEKNLVVIAAAGNTPEELEFYPASYENVISVGASSINDEIGSSATYSYKIDLMAPGERVFTLDNGDTYRYTGFGSSFSAPQVAGAAAIVKHHFSNYDAKQVMERLRVTADNIDNISGNTPFAGKLGNGRLNMFRALTDPQRPSVRFEQLSFQSTIPDFYFAGDTISFHGTFTNYLEATSAGTATLTSLSEYVTVIDGDYDLDQLITGQSVSNEESPFRIVLNDNTPSGERIPLRIAYADQTGYSDFEYVLIYTAPDYLYTSSGNINLTTSSSGDLARSIEDGFINGLFIDEIPVISSLGLAIGNHEDTLFNNAINIKSDGNFSNDFTADRAIRYFNNSIAEEYTFTKFKTNTSSSKSLIVEQSTMSFEEEDNIVMLQYRLINNDPQTIKNLNVGLIADFDFDENESGYDMGLNLGYAFRQSESSTFYTAIIPLNTDDFSFMSTHIDSLGGSGSNISDATKYALISQDSVLAYDSGAPYADFIHGYGINLDSIEPNRSEKVAFAFISAYSLEELFETADKARDLYDRWNAKPPHIFENTICSGDMTSVSIEGIQLYEDQELTTLLSDDGSLMTNQIVSDTVFYAVDTTNAYPSDVFSVSILTSKVEADFDFSNDTLLIGGHSGNKVTMHPGTALIDMFEWELANNLNSTLVEPSQVIDNAGSYDITLSTTDVFGCKDSISKTLLVALPGSSPAIDDIFVCEGSSANIIASNTNSIAIYKDSLRQQIIHEGSNFTTPTLYENDYYYVSNISEPIESIPIKVPIWITEIEAGFKIMPDTADNAPLNSVSLVDNSLGNVTEYRWFIDGVNQGNTPSVSFVVSTGSDNLFYIATTDNGCSDTLINTLNYQESITATQENRRVCIGDDYTLTPEGGEYFAFYEDNAKETLISKGSGLLIENFTTPRTIYVASLDQLIESEAVVPIDISPIGLPTGIIADPVDSLILTDFQRTASFSFNSSEASSFEWYLNDQLIDQSANPILFFDTAGLYAIKAIVRNEFGCEDTLNTNYTIANPIVTSARSKLTPSIKVFPNPVTDQFTIQSQSPLKGTLEILDITGKVLLKEDLNGEKTMNIDLSSQDRGQYFIRILGQYLNYSTKTTKL